jgi:predicted outer membrane repeat protein
MFNNPAQQAGRTVWRRKRWLVVGIAGVAGLATVSALTGVPDFTRAPKSNNSHIDQSSNGGQTDNSQRGADEHGGQDPGRSTPPGQPVAPPGPDGGNSRYGAGDRDAKTLPCDSDRLIAALVRANAGDGGTIELARNCTYILTANQPFNPWAPTGTGNGLPLITQPVTLKGEDTSIVRAANADPFRIFEVDAGGDLTLKGLTVNGGQSPNGDERGGGGILVDAGGELRLEDSAVTHNTTVGPGGGIANRGFASVKHSTISYNSANEEGGAIWSQGLLKVEESKLAFNTVREDGGGLSVVRGSTLLAKTTIENNNAAHKGGGINSEGSTVQIDDSTIAKNTAGVVGGGLNNDEEGNVTLRHTSVSRNNANGHAGGIENDATLVIEDGDVTDNTTKGAGGGIGNGSDGNLVVRDSEVARNNAVGPASVAGGIFNTGTAALTDSKVIDNSSTNPPGGIFSSNDNFTVDDDSIIVRNRPTNCAGSPATIPNCFG